MSIKPRICTFATPPHIKEMQEKSQKKSRKRLFDRLRGSSSSRGGLGALLTPPTSPELISDKKPKVLRMPEENKQLLQFCTVCASNQNRSMEAHRLLKEAGYNVGSFGTGGQVRLPGPAIDKPVVYQFGTPYDRMYSDLMSRDQRLYTNNGVLKMLDRNRGIKDHPEKWQDHRFEDQIFDVVFTCQERCFDSVCIDLLHRGAKLCRPVHVINIEIEDNHEEAAVGGKAILELANMIVASPDPDSQMVDILTEWQKKHQNLPSLYQLCYF